MSYPTRSVLPSSRLPEIEVQTGLRCIRCILGRCRIPRNRAFVRIFLSQLTNSFENRVRSPGRGMTHVLLLRLYVGARQPNAVEEIKINRLV